MRAPCARRQYMDFVHYLILSSHVPRNSLTTLLAGLSLRNAPSTAGALSYTQQTKGANVEGDSPDED